MAVLLGQVAFGGGADVSEEERGGRFRCYARKVDAVPCWDRGCEDTGFRTQGRRGVVPNAEAIAVVRAPSVLGDVSRSSSEELEMVLYQTEARVEGLCEDRV